MSIPGVEHESRNLWKDIEECGLRLSGWKYVLWPVV